MKAFRILASLAATLALIGGTPALHAQTVLTMSSWVPPTHSLTRDVLRRVGEAGRAGDQRPRQVRDAAQAPVGASRHLRRGARRPRRRLLRHRELHAGAPSAAADGRAARRRRDRRDQLGRVLAHPLEVLPAGQRVQGRQAARRLHARPGADVHGQEAGHVGRRPGGHEDPQRRRHLRSVGQGARRLAARQARARVVRAALLGRRRRHVLPERIDQVVQPRQGRQVRDPVPRRLLLVVVRLLHERGQVEQAVEAGPGRDHVRLGRAHRAPRRQVVGRRRQGRPRSAEGRQRDDHRGEPGVRRRRAPAHRAAGAGVDQVGERQGRRRRQGLGRVPGRAEEGGVRK